MLTCSIAACSRQRTRGRLPSTAVLAQDDLLLTSLLLVRVHPLKGLNRVLVSLDELSTGHFLPELLRKHFERSIEELLFVVFHVGGMFVDMFLPTPDVLLDVVLHGASVPNR